ncbi:substrate-binding domain-containing protein [Paludisphaera mucosa]|uniref:Substrate-binding domain-containing protein n=1 Tax=Paludisphaera mucosa TaxID=3030827 RepID=A0ABT6FEX0_9BACT|nr:substrate-binding domain-containing protein [Paludisphaera mucosa]MDG3006125.1 substrate-binding domain-containing protein [Paludisphaera mucosa]
MANSLALDTNLRGSRLLRGWSQEDLARASGLSRAGVSAIETGRLVPSAAAALALAAALDCRVEDLFRLRGPDVPEAAWAWPPGREPCRYWRAEVGGRRMLYPYEPTLAGAVAHDGVFEGGRFREGDEDEAGRTLVMAGCDPAVGFLAAGLARVANVRLIALPRSSRAALDLLGRGLVHVAGVHLAGADEPGGNGSIVREALGAGYELVRAASWEEGVALAPCVRASSVRAAVDSKLRWVGREIGSGARRCLDELLEGRSPPRRIASDHRGVAEAVRHGWADAGVCLRLVVEEAGLGFLPVRNEGYDLCFPERLEGDHRIQALLRVLRSPSHRKLLGELPGYDSAETGELRPVD